MSAVLKNRFILYKHDEIWCENLTTYEFLESLCDIGMNIQCLEGPWPVLVNPEHHGVSKQVQTVSIKYEFKLISYSHAISTLSSTPLLWRELGAV